MELTTILLSSIVLILASSPAYADSNILEPGAKVEKLAE